MHSREVPTQIGRLRLFADEAGLRAIAFPDRPGLAGALDPEPGRGSQEIFASVIGQLGEYFAGERREFDLPLSPEGTDFQREVWAALLEIPYGRTTTYGDIARRIGRPDAVRAVGAANGRNPIPIVIPCHRVVGSDGSLTGFGGGLPLKRWLLALEAGQRQTLAPDSFAETRRR